LISVVKDAICGGGEAVPKSPKTAKWISTGGVVRVFCKEMAGIDAGSKVVGGAGVKRGAEKVDLDKVPAWSKGTGGAVSDKEETAGGCSDRGEQGRTGRKGGKMGRIVIGDKRDGGSCGKGGGRERKKAGRVGDGGVGKIKGSGKGGGLSREPDVVVHLDVKGDFSGCGTGE
jgi:hypothetical protein